jgi:hypothetical protein
VALEFVLDPSLIREGSNEIVVFNETPKPESPAACRAAAVKLVSVELGIR